MKRTIILLACALGIFTANAQSVVESTKFTDNWSVGINAGAITPLTHSAFFKSMRPAFGVGFSKQFAAYVDTGRYSPSVYLLCSEVLESIFLFYPCFYIM